MAILPNPKHEAFAQAIASGKTGADAYRQAGYSVRTDDAGRANASRLLANDSVASRVRELQAVSAEEAVVSAVALSEQLEDIRRKAIEANQFGAAATAVMGRAKLHGLIIDKAQVEDVTPMDPDQRRARIADLASRFAQSR